MSSPLSQPTYASGVVGFAQSLDKSCSGKVFKTSTKDPFEELHAKIQNIELSRHRFEADNERFIQEAFNTKKKLSTAQSFRPNPSSDHWALDDPKIFISTPKTSPQNAPPAFPRGLVHVSCVSEAVSSKQNVLPNEEVNYWETLEKRCNNLEKQLEILRNRLTEMSPREPGRNATTISEGHLKCAHNTSHVVNDKEDESPRPAFYSTNSISRTPRLNRKVSVSRGEPPFVVGRSTSASHHAAVRMQQSRTSRHWAPTDSSSNPSSARKTVVSAPTFRPHRAAESRTMWCNWDEEELAYPQTPTQKADLLLNDRGDPSKKENGITRFSHPRHESAGTKPLPGSNSSSSTLDSQQGCARKFSSSHPLTTKSSSSNVFPKTKAPIWL